MEAVRGTAIQFGPTVLIAGWSAYPQIVDFAAFRAIADEVGAHLWVDMAHFVGLVAACLHPSPVPHADLVSTTVHKTFGGARSGPALGRQRFAKPSTRQCLRVGRTAAHAGGCGQAGHLQGRGDAGVRRTPAPHASGATSSPRP
jgi:glycine/serine hydroxymethyltransferase